MRATPPTGLPVLRPLSSFMHASANTPAGAASASIALFPAATGLPLFRAGSTPTLPVSGPARRSLTFRPACSLNRLSRSFCQSASIHVVTSMNRPDCYQPETIVAGRDSHPLERGAFHGARGSRARTLRSAASVRGSASRRLWRRRRWPRGSVPRRHCAARAAPVPTAPPCAPRPPASEHKPGAPHGAGVGRRRELDILAVFEAGTIIDGPTRTSALAFDPCLAQDPLDGGVVDAELGGDGAHPPVLDDARARRERHRSKDRRPGSAIEPRSLAGRCSSAAPAA